MKNNDLLRNFVRGSVRDVLGMPDLKDAEIEEYHMDQTISKMLYDYADHDAAILMELFRSTFQEMGLIIRVKISIDE